MSPNVSGIAASPIYTETPQTSRAVESHSSLEGRQLHTIQVLHTFIFSLKKPVFSILSESLPTFRGNPFSSDDEDDTYCPDAEESDIDISSDEDDSLG